MSTLATDERDDHGIATAPERSLRIALALIGTLLIAEVVGGVTNSLALLSDGAHMFTDVAALAIALLAIRIGKRAADRRRTFGYACFEILAATFNAVLLFRVAMWGDLVFHAVWCDLTTYVGRHAELPFREHTHALAAPNWSEIQMSSYLSRLRR